jgi:AAA+ superfamily predicted ATPase
MYPCGSCIILIRQFQIFSLNAVTFARVLRTLNLPSANLASARTMITESPLRDLEAIIRSRTPLIAMESNEEPQIVRMVRQIAQKFQLKAYRWTITEGLQAFDPNDQPSQSVTKSQEVLNYIKSSSNNCLFVLLDFHPYLSDAVHVRYLKDIALTYPKHYSTVVVVGFALKIPEELQPFTARFRLPLPTHGELRAIVYDAAGEWGAEHGRRDVQTTNKAVDLLVRNLVGLTATDARRLAYKAIQDDGVISESEMPEVMRAKYELLERDSVLSFEYETAKFSEIGGMRRLREWLNVRKDFFLADDNEVHLDPPRGLLLLGVQGCGKSLVAKATAGIFGVPLLRLDFGVLYNKYYGETERNLRKAFETAEVMSPCVLWLDEIEKGVAVQDDDDGLSRRMLGTFLTWMSERKKPVFVVATANDIVRLPPELVRKGRFDEIFFVDLPMAQNRRDILNIHFRKRSLDPAEFDLDALAPATDGFSGSEIEQAIVSATYTARAQGHTLAQDDLLAEIRQTRPLSVVMKEKVEATREWASSRTVSCD